MTKIVNMDEIHQLHRNNDTKMLESRSKVAEKINQEDRKTVSNTIKALCYDVVMLV